jgi:1,2-phenylacetyl-CoA epoxidase catalytic subunit
MTLINDRITFVADDFAELSDSAKAALIPYCGTNPFHSMLSDLANNHLITAQRIAWSAAEAPELRPLVVNFAKATDEAKEAVAVSLKAAETLLGASPKPESPLDIPLEEGEIVK